MPDTANDKQPKLVRYQVLAPCYVNDTLHQPKDAAGKPVFVTAPAGLESDHLKKVGDASPDADTGEDGAPMSGAAPYRPRDLPSDCHGATDRETIDKLVALVVSQRDAIDVLDAEVNAARDQFANLLVDKQARDADAKAKAAPPPPAKGK